MDGVADRETTRLYLEAVDENLRRIEAEDGRYVAIVVADSLRTNASHRKAIARELEERRDRIQRRCAGNALVTTSTTARGLLTALRWITDLPVPVEVFPTLEEAHAWADLVRSGRRP